MIVLTSIVLLNHKYISELEIKHAIDAYNLMIIDNKERKKEYLDLNFETVQKTLRVSSRKFTNLVYSNS